METLVSLSPALAVASVALLVVIAFGIYGRRNTGKHI